MMKDEDAKPTPSANNSSEEKDKPPRDEKSTPEKGPHSFNDDKPAVHQISDEKKAEIEQERQQSQALILEKQKQIEHQQQIERQKDQLHQIEIQKQREIQLKEIELEKTKAA